MLRLQVQHDLQAFVEPRLATFADRLGDLMAAAHEELRGVERQLEAVHSKTENHFAGVDARLQMLVDSAQRSEQRERDLNNRVAGLAEGILRRKTEHIFESSPPAVALARAEGPWSAGTIADDLSGRVQLLEEVKDRLDGGMRRVERRLSDVEGCGQDVAGLSTELRHVLKDCSWKAAGQARWEERLSTLERCLHDMHCEVGDAGQHADLAAFCQSVADPGRVADSALAVEEHVKGMQQHVADLERASDEIRADVCTARERHAACSGRVDDATSKLSALRIKVDALERRVLSLGERLELKAEPSDVTLAVPHKEDESRLSALELRMDCLHESCQDAVDQVAEACFRRYFDPHGAASGSLQETLPSSARDRRSGRSAFASGRGGEHGFPCAGAAAKGTPPQPTNFGNFMQHQ